VTQAGRTANGRWRRHDAVNRQVLAAFDARLGDPDTIPQDNGCFNTLEWQDDGWAVLSVNELPDGP
jgi:hypothetical protein